jgi:hypothetical protein
MGKSVSAYHYVVAFSGAPINQEESIYPITQTHPLICGLRLSLMKRPTVLNLFFVKKEGVNDEKAFDY